MVVQTKVSSERYLHFRTSAGRLVQICADTCPEMTKLAARHLRSATTRLQTHHITEASPAKPATSFHMAPGRREVNPLLVPAFVAMR